ncbi:hypothetical protein AGDE_13143 [Angomonas deanei]|uniref:Uncharacterized protein n=1 Tax=Angomonas deanei TaxID=59799 RepID=A0A7G2C6M7_9TRYP|nr:hypothetical protein AGDE_13143 [Angomonas deanei]CAD2215478.1 hypothetical protein, conserved [Angomonas deanei]|eukprot:EPY22646.1 hypothetical protein AGDE_13143 [Angomonas deanei]
MSRPVPSPPRRPPPADKRNTGTTSPLPMSMSNRSDTGIQVRTDGVLRSMAKMTSVKDTLNNITISLLTCGDAVQYTSGVVSRSSVVEREAAQFCNQKRLQTEQDEAAKDKKYSQLPEMTSVLAELHKGTQQQQQRQPTSSQPLNPYTTTPVRRDQYAMGGRQPAGNVPTYGAPPASVAPTVYSGAAQVPYAQVHRPVGQYHAL